jgi:hypothetical protein
MYIVAVIKCLFILFLLASDDVVAEVSAEAVPPRDGDEQKDNVGARIGERVMIDDQAIAYDGPDSRYTG